MAFSENIVKECWELVEGRCECSKKAHNHTNGTCNKHLIWEKQGQVGWGAWKPCPIDGVKEHDNLSNCQILCFDCQ
jgi:hypothetical protein